MKKLICIVGLFCSVLAHAATNHVPFSANLSWEPVLTTNVLGYRVYYGNAPRKYNFVRQLGGRETSNLIITNLNARLDWYFTVLSFDFVNLGSDYSEEVNLTNLFPKNIQFFQVARKKPSRLNKIILEWNLANNIDYYNLEYSDNVDITGAITWKSERIDGEKNLVEMYLQRGVNYFKIQGVNKFGKSDFSHTIMYWYSNI